MEPIVIRNPDAGSVVQYDVPDYGKPLAVIPSGPNAGQLAPSNDSKFQFYYGPPKGSGAEDFAAIDAIMAAAPPGSEVILVPSDLPYICDHTQITARSNITFNRNGQTVHSFTKYGIQYSPIIGSPQYPVAPPIIATLNGAQAKYASTLDVLWTGADRLVDGDYLYIENAETGRVSFQVFGAVVGNSVPIDLPLLYALETGCSVRKYTPIQNFRIIGGGVWDAMFDSHHVPFDGALDDSRAVYLAVVWNCETDGGTWRQVTGPTGTIGVIGIIGYDIGGRNNRIANLIVGGNDPTSAMSDGLAIEGQRGTTIEHIRTRNIGYGMWFNSNCECNVNDVISDTGCGVVIPTAIDIVLPAYEMGGHNNTLSGLKMTNIVGGAGNGAFRSGPDFSDNEITDITVDGGTYQTGAALVLGSNGATPCARNHFGVVNVSNLSDAVIYGASVPSHDNVIDNLIVNNVKTLVTMGSVGQSLQIRNVRGLLAIPEKLVDVVNSTLTMGTVDLTTPDGLRYTNSDSVTLAGATAVYVPAPWVTSDNRVTLARTAPGGTSHGIPSYGIHQNTGSQVGTAGYTPVGLASFAGDVMTEDNNNSVHYIVLAALPGYVRGPLVYRVTIKANGRQWVQLAAGPSSAYFNVVTGALGGTSGASIVTRSAKVNADGSVSCTLETRDTATADCYMLMASADGVPSYLGTGATFTLSDLSITGLNFVSLVAEANNNDVYSVNVQ